MKSRLLLVAAALALAGPFAGGAWAQRDAAFRSVDEARSAMQRALAERQAATARAKKLEAAAARASEAADKTAQQAAALAARIQESEAGIDAAEARLAIIARQRQLLDAQLAARQKPVIRLTAALERFSRRPLALSVLRPGSVREIVYLRALLSSTIPVVRQRTAALRTEIARGKALQREAEQALAALRAEQGRLTQRKTELAALESRQRVESRQASGTAAREAERALSLAEQARDLDALVGKLDQAGALRKQLAMLPGPLMRPPRPEESQVVADAPTISPEATRPPAGYELPVAGRTVTGFGAPTEGGGLSEGLTLATRDGAQVVAPAAGRVAFAGPYKGYGRIVIIEHDGGWTSLVTGLARIDVQVGEDLVGGAPLGIAGAPRPTITLELRRDGKPVNPVDYLG
jgi:septal ring factor EnvC (AmiA/AmiB activator)